MSNKALTTTIDGSETRTATLTITDNRTGKTWDVGGRGAGRWPTTEAVLADLFDLRRESILKVAEEEQECVA